MENRNCTNDLCEKCIHKNTTGFRKAFGGRTFNDVAKMRKVLEIINKANLLGWDADFEEFVKGCSWFFIKNNNIFIYALNISTNDFIVFLPESDEFDNDREVFMNDIEWYKKLIELLYA